MSAKDQQNWYANYKPGEEPESIKQGLALGKMESGLPRGTRSISSDELKKQGYLGAYLLPGHH